MMRMTLRIGFVAATLFVSAQTSQAAVLTVADPSDPITWSFNTGTSTLDGTGTISATGFNSSTLTLTVTLTQQCRPYQRASHGVRVRDSLRTRLQ
jgi:hypothetical protein